MDDELIEFRGVSKKFGKNVVFQDVDLAIPEGEITGIIGASGEGKSTMLKLLAGFYKPSKGKIYYRKREVCKDRSNIKRLFGLAIEDGSFYEKLTVKENLFHFGRLYNINRKVLVERIDELMRLVGLGNAKDTIAENLSIGMKKRLDIACSMIHNPAILVLDEPTADLDPLLRKQIIKIIKEINANGTTIILTTQLLEEAEEICKKVIILFNENIKEQESPRKIMLKYNCSDLNEVFQKIFTAEGRKTYQESKNKKTKFSFRNNGLKNSKTLKLNREEMYRLIEEVSKDKNSDSFLEEIKKGDSYVA